jgi:hypothetical protein
MCGTQFMKRAHDRATMVPAKPSSNASRDAFKPLANTRTCSEIAQGLRYALGAELFCRIG